MEGEKQERKLIYMKTLIILLLISTTCFSQGSRGYVLHMDNGTIDIPDNSVPISKVVGLQEALNATGITLSQVYPVGSIYISVNPTNPSQLFGGTWEAFAVGRTLIGLNPNDTDFDTAEETGGSKTVTLTEGQLPAHSHIIPDVRSATTGGASTRIARTVDASSTAGGDVATATAGSGESINILNPYLTVYLFKRTQ